MNHYLLTRVIEINENGGNWENLIYEKNGELDYFTYDLLLDELHLNNETKETIIDKEIENFFNSIIKKWRS